jgi:predicted nucleotidyltransferase
LAFQAAYAIIQYKAGIESKQAMDKFESLRNYLASEPQVSLAYLFGSQANGVIGPLSDYDLGVLVERPSAELRYRLSYHVGRLMDTDRVDLVLLNQAPVELAYAIIAQGRLLYQRNLALRVEFEAGVLSRYGDYVPILRQQRQDILQGGRHEARVHRYREALGRTERTLAAIGAAQGQDSG